MVKSVLIIVLTLTCLFLSIQYNRALKSMETFQKQCVSLLKEQDTLYQELQRLWKGKDTTNHDDEN